MRHWARIGRVLISIVAFFFVSMIRKTSISMSSSFLRSTFRRRVGELFSSNRPLSQTPLSKVDKVVVGSYVQLMTGQITPIADTTSQDFSAKFLKLLSHMIGLNRVHEWHIFFLVRSANQDVKPEEILIIGSSGCTFTSQAKQDILLKKQELVGGKLHWKALFSQMDLYRYLDIHRNS